MMKRGFTSASEERRGSVSFHSSRTAKQTRPGFTLIEVVVTVAITAIIFVAVADASLSLLRSQNTSVGASEGIGSAVSGIELFENDVRAMQYGDNGAYPINSMSPYAFSFYADTPLGSGAELVTYTLSGTTLTRSVVPPGYPPTYGATPGTEDAALYVHNLDNSTSVFRYFDASGNPITDPNQAANVRTVSITLTIQPTPQNVPYHFTANATLRNLHAL